MFSPTKMSMDFEVQIIFQAQFDFVVKGELANIINQQFVNLQSSKIIRQHSLLTRLSSYFYKGI